MPQPDPRLGGTQSDYAVAGRARNPQTTAVAHFFHLSADRSRPPPPPAQPEPADQPAPVAAVDAGGLRPALNPGAVLDMQPIDAVPVVDRNVAETVSASHG